MEDTYDRTRVNHGHDRWNSDRFVADLQPWCAACRRAPQCEAPSTVESRTSRTTYYCRKATSHDGLHVASDGHGGTVAW